MDLNDKWQSVWASAIRHALDVLVAYPSAFSQGNVPIRAFGGQFGSDFIEFLTWRLELARSDVAMSFICDNGLDLTTNYRHTCVYTRDIGSGSLHFPKLIDEKLRGFPRGVPVLRGMTNTSTPENLLISEVLVQIASLARMGVTKGKSDAADCKRLLQSCGLIEAKQPWAGLRSAPRPHLRDLCLSVQNRMVAGVIGAGHPAYRLSELYLKEPITNPEVCDEITGSFLRLVSDPDARDKIFELIALSLILMGIRQSGTSFTIFPDRFVASAGKPFAQVCGTKGILSFYFQTGVPLGKPLYVDRRDSGSRLGGIPDFIVEWRSGAQERRYLLDPKCRGSFAETDVVYKMLGYKNNFGLNPYYGIALMPDFGEGCYRRIYKHPTEQSTVGIIRFSLELAESRWPKLLARLFKTAVGSYSAASASAA